MGVAVGTRLTYEHKKKLSLAQMGHTVSEETRQLISTLAKERCRKMKEDGTDSILKRSPETRLKMSIAHKGKIFSEEHKNKIRLVNLGKKHTQETKDKISKNNSHRIYPYEWGSERIADVKMRNQKSTYLRKKFGISIDDFDNIVNKQEGKCPICNKILKIGMGKHAIDHDHSTGKMREILCQRCNVLLGACSDTISVLEKAIEYLNKWKIINGAFLLRQGVKNVRMD